MVSKEPFHVGHSPTVACIPCVQCGHNMHCVRRSQVSLGELQQFTCSTCGSARDRLVTEQASDSDIQREAERLCGVAGKAA